MPNANPTLAYPMHSIFHRLALGFKLGALGFTLGSLGFALGSLGLALGMRGFLDTNVLV